MITWLEDFRTYNLAMEIAEEAWEIVSGWSWFAKDTVGRPYVEYLPMDKSPAVYENLKPNA